MDKTVVVILVIVALLVVGVIMYQSSQASQRDREMQMQLASLNQTTPQSNVWSSLDDVGGLVTAISGLFGKKDPVPTAPTSAAAIASDPSILENSDINASITQENAAINKTAYLVANVENSMGSSFASPNIVIDKYSELNA